MGYCTCVKRKYSVSRLSCSAHMGWGGFPPPLPLSYLTLLNPSKLVNTHNSNKPRESHHTTSTPPLQGSFECRPTFFGTEARHFGRSLWKLEAGVLTVEILVNGPAEKPVLINDIHTSCSRWGGDVIPSNRWQPLSLSPPPKVLVLLAMNEEQ